MYIIYSLLACLGLLSAILIEFVAVVCPAVLPFGWVGVLLGLFFHWLALLLFAPPRRSGAFCTAPQLQPQDWAQLLPVGDQAVVFAPVFEADEPRAWFWWAWLLAILVFGAILGIVGFVRLSLLTSWWEAIPLGLLLLTVVFFGYTLCPRRHPTPPPGPGNERLANELVAGAAVMAERPTSIYTQEAILWALQNGAPGNGYVAAGPGVLAGHLNNVPVSRMHLHVPGENVRTLETLSLALGQFAPNPPPRIVLVAHDKHIERAYSDLCSMYPAVNIKNPGIRNVPYRNRDWLRAIEWAFRELVIAGPLEFVHRTVFRCHPNLTLHPIPPGGGHGGGGAGGQGAAPQPAQPPVPPAAGLDGGDGAVAPAGGAQ